MRFNRMISIPAGRSSMVVLQPFGLSFEAPVIGPLYTGFMPQIPWRGSQPPQSPYILTCPAREIAGGLKTTMQPLM